jgi:hypothetical protein
MPGDGEAGDERTKGKCRSFDSERREERADKVTG